MKCQQLHMRPQALSQVMSIKLRNVERHFIAIFTISFQNLTNARMENLIVKQNYQNASHDYGYVMVRVNAATATMNQPEHAVSILWQ